MKKVGSIVIFVILLGTAVYVAPWVFNFVSANVTDLNFSDGMFYYSLDGGDTFLKSSRGLMFSEINNLAFGPDQKLYLSTNQGLFSSSQIGDQWNKVVDDGGVLGMTVKVQQVVFLNSGKVLLAIYNAGRGKIYQTDSDFKKLKEVYAVATDKTEITDLQLDVKNQKVYFSSSDGVFGYSDDGGGSFKLAKRFSNSLSKIFINPFNTEEIFLMGQNFFQKTMDAGNSFVDLGVNLISLGAFEFNDLHISRLGVVFLASNHGAWRSFDGGLSWAKLDSLLPRDLPSTAVSYNDDLGKIMVAFDGRLYLSQNGSDWTVRTINQSNRIDLIRVHPADPKVILVGFVH